MSPIARHLIKHTQRIRDSTLRHNTLRLIEEATKQPDLVQFTMAILKNPSHTSHSDPTPHATALLATEEQAKDDRSQTVHIYHDGSGNYTGHTLYPERQNKKSDD